MLHLAPFSMTWDGDWTLFTRMTADFVQETGLPGDALALPGLCTRLVQLPDDLLLRKLYAGQACVGFLCARLQADAAELLALRIHADKRGQGLGRSAGRIPPPLRGHCAWL